jgi:hypothetical protein
MVALAKQLCSAADQLLQQKRYADAEARYRVVLLYLPESPRAMAGMEKVRAAGTLHSR